MTSVLRKGLAVFRKGFALALSIAVPFAALCAPPVHAHVDDHGGEIHAHYSPHSSHATTHDHDGSERARPTHVEESENDEQAVFLQLFVAVSAQAFALPAVTPPPLELAPPAEAGLPARFQVVHGHDPPSLTSLPSRAPPSHPL